MERVEEETKDGLANPRSPGKQPLKWWSQWWQTSVSSIC